MMSKSYTFCYTEEGQHQTLSEHLYVETDPEAWKACDKFIAAKPGRTYVSNSMEMHERRLIPDRPKIKQAPVDRPSGPSWDGGEEWAEAEVGAPALSKYAQRPLDGTI